MNRKTWETDMFKKKEYFAHDPDRNKNKGTEVANERQDTLVSYYYFLTPFLPFCPLISFYHNSAHRGYDDNKVNFHSMLTTPECAVWEKDTPLTYFTD